jgi:hypothetical protein
VDSSRGQQETHKLAVQLLGLHEVAQVGRSTFPRRKRGNKARAALPQWQLGGLSQRVARWMLERLSSISIK